MKKIPDGSIDLVLTDPPYGTTACKWDTIIPFEPMWEQLKRVTKKNGAIVLFGSQPFTSALVMSNPKMFKYEWVWVKSKATGFLDCKKRPLNNVETIDVFSSGTPIYYPQMIEGKTHKNGGFATGPANVYGDFSNRTHTESNLYYPKRTIYFKTEHGLHPTQKPVALMEYLIKTYTNEGETVLDFTMGSGTTGVACKNLNRNFIGIELDKDYFEIAKARIVWQPIHKIFIATKGLKPPTPTRMMSYGSVTTS